MNIIEMKKTCREYDSIGMVMERKQYDFNLSNTQWKFHRDKQTTHCSPISDFDRTASGYSIKAKSRRTNADEQIDRQRRLTQTTVFK